MFGQSKPQRLGSHHERQRGQGMTEYIIIVAVIAIAAIGVFGFFGDAVENQVSGMAAEVAGNSAANGIQAAQTAANNAAAAAAPHKNLGNYNANSQTAAGGE